MTFTKFCTEVGGQVPWHRINWTGKFLSFDDTPTTEFGPEDLDKVFAVGHRDTGSMDGEAAAIVLLKDGRWVAWESTWGPTGDGFCCDAYGGDANIYFSSSLADAIALGLSLDARDMLGLKIEEWSDPNCKLPKLERITQ